MFALTNKSTKDFGGSNDNEFWKDVSYAPCVIADTTTLSYKSRISRVAFQNLSPYCCRASLTPCRILRRFVVSFFDC